MVEMMKIHCHFSISDIKKIKAYLGKTYNMFKIMQLELNVVSYQNAKI